MGTESYNYELEEVVQKHFQSKRGRNLPLKEHLEK